MSTNDAVLNAERGYLAQARADLRRMREHTLSLRALSADRVSEAYLQAALYRRARSLVDDPSVPLFFGRIDLGTAESFHIGRRHVMDAAGDPVVVDWRAEISGAFYRATRTDPHGVTLRRRFGFAGGEITSYEDEHLTDTTEPEVRSRILTEEIERPRVGPMRDHRGHDPARTVRRGQCRPGPDHLRTGCARNRKDRRRPASSGLPAACPPNAAGSQWGAHRRTEPCVHALHPPGASRARRGRRPAGHRGGAGGKRAGALGRPAARGPAQGRSPAGRGRPPGRLEPPGDPGRHAGGAARHPPVAGTGPRGRRRHRSAPRAGRPVRRGTRSAAPAVGAPGPAADGGDRRDHRRPSAGRGRTFPAGARARRRGLAAAGSGPAGDAAARRAGVPGGRGRRPAERRRTAADPVGPAGPRNPHRAVVARRRRARLRGPRCRRADPDRRTRRARRGAGPVPDGAAGRRPSGRCSIRDGARRHRPRNDAVGDRVVDSRAGPPWHIGRPHRGLAAGLPGAGHGRRAASREGSVGVIGADADAELLRAAFDRAGAGVGDLDDEDDPRLVLVPATLANGLEFDHVIVVEPAAIAAAEPRGLRRLYVVLTRAVSSLTIVHAEPLPPPLRGRT